MPVQLATEPTQEADKQEAVRRDAKDASPEEDVANFPVLIFLPVFREQFGVVVDVIKNVAVQEYLLATFEFLAELVPDDSLVAHLTFREVENHLFAVDVEIVVRAKLDFDNSFTFVFDHFGVIKRQSGCLGEVDGVLDDRDFHVATQEGFYSLHSTEFVEHGFHRSQSYVFVLVLHCLVLSEPMV